MEHLLTWASGGVTSTLHEEQVTWSQYAHYGLGITESIHTMLGHCDAIPGYQSVIGYGVDTGSSIVVLVNNQIAPNTLFLRRCRRTISAT